MTHKTYKITKVTKSRIPSYVKFELDGNIEFNDKKQSFIFCVNKYPFKNCQIGDEIEINLTGARRLNTNSYHDEIAKKMTSRNMPVDDYNMQWQEEERRRFQQLQEQAQKQKSLHKMKVALDTFYNVLEPLEEYIEKSGDYHNFISKRQIYRKNIQDSEGPLENDEDLFLSNLYIFARTFHGKPEFFMKVIQENFYKWINAVGITAENSSEELKHFLIEINNILEGNDEKIVRESIERNKNVDIDPKEMVGIFAGIQNPLNKNRWQRKELEGRKWSELGDEDKLKGDADLGKRTFEEIKENISIPHEDFRLRYFGAKRPAQRIKNPGYKPFVDDPFEEFLNENDWEIRKNFAVSFDGKKREDVLVRKGVRIVNQDYDVATGELINQPNKVYRQGCFSDKDKKKIGIIFPVSAFHRELVDSIKENVSEWIMSVINNGGEQSWIVHNSVGKDELGRWIFDVEKMHQREEFSQEEWAEIEAVLNDYQVFKSELGNLTHEQLINEVWKLNKRIVELESKGYLTTSEIQKKQQYEMKLEKIQNILSFKGAQQPANSNSFTPLLIGGASLAAVIGLFSFLIVRKRKRNK